MKPSVFIHPICPKPFDDMIQRAEFIEKGGWDKMPGQEKTDYTVGRECADGLDLLIKK